MIRGELMRTAKPEPQQTESTDRLRERVAKLRRLAEDPRTPIEERRRAYEKWADLAQRLPRPPRPEPVRRQAHRPSPRTADSDFFEALSPTLQVIVVAAAAFEVIMGVLGTRRRRGPFG